MFSVIYTPTEGDAIQNYSRLFRKPEGCFLSIEDQDRIDECLANIGCGEDVDYIVVSDGEEVLRPYINVFYFSTMPMGFVPDSRHWRSRARCSSHFGCQTCPCYPVCGNSSVKSDSCSPGLWYRCNLPFP